MTYAVTYSGSHESILHARRALRGHYTLAEAIAAVEAVTGPLYAVPMCGGAALYASQEYYDSCDEPEATAVIDLEK